MILLMGLILLIIVIINFSKYISDSQSLSGHINADTHYQLKDIIENVTTSSGYEYGAKDNLGNGLDTIKIIDNPNGSGYLGVYHVFDSIIGIYTTKFATSNNLKNWTFKVDLAYNSSQPYIISLSNGGFLLAVEADNHGASQIQRTWIRFYYYSSLDRLYNGTFDRIFDAPHSLVPITSGAEGTPNIYSAKLSPDLNNSIIEVGFHYSNDGIVDRQVRGKLVNFSLWTTTVENNVNDVIISLGVKGNIGDRDNLIYDKYNYNIIEGQLTKGNWSSWRIFIYDWNNNSSTQLSIRTHKGSKSFANPSITKIKTPDGLPGIVVSLFLPSEGVETGEGGELIYYNNLKTS